jgi:AcrR family transcriptional regulator
MKAREKIVEVAIKLASERPIDQISFSDIAKISGVHWTTVRRHLGNKQQMRTLLYEKQAELGPSYLDTKTRILDAATRVFGREGYSGTTLDQVASDAGMTKGAVYWHFSSKSDLYLALCERSVETQLQDFPNQAEALLSSADPINALASLLIHQLKFCTANPEKPMLFFDFITSSRDPTIKEKLAKTHMKMFDEMSHIISSVQERGLLTNTIDSRSLAVIFHSLVNGLMMTWLVDPDDVQFEDLVPTVSHILLKGLNPTINKS